MSLLDMLGGVLSHQDLNSATQSMATQVGATPEQTQHAMEAAVPLILSGLTRNAQTPEGEAALSSALAQHDGSALDGLGQGQLPSAQDGQAILGHVFGNQTPAAANAVAQRSGIDPAMAMQILSMVAPLVLGMLGRGQQSGAGMGGGLGGMLGSLLGGGASQAGGLGGMLGSIMGGGQPQAQPQTQPQAQDGGLGGMLGSLLGGGQPAQAQPQAGGLGGVMGTLNNVLDGNGNGNALNDLVGMLGGRR
ncbi:DUF937 domain-containing protein [Deinococcus sp.]|uniref:DUF937 domain-containing protein n=1 Tax=Deinococcus sp. TaxID=47478 RepID=UPI003CC6697B